MRTLRIITLVSIIITVSVLAVGCQGVPGPQGPQGPQGEPGGLSWGDPQSPAPYVFDIGTTGGNHQIGPLSPGDRVSFDFTVSGSKVYYWVQDTYLNIILTGCGGDRVISGEGSFIAAGSGSYWLVFESTGLITPSVITINYTIWPVWRAE